MSVDLEEVTEIRNWKTKVMLVGAVIGAMVGLGAAYIFTQKADNYDAQPELTTGDGVKLGLLVLGLMRSVAELGDGK